MYNPVWDNWLICSKSCPNIFVSIVFVNTSFNLKITLVPEISKNEEHVFGVVDKMKLLTLYFRL